MHLTIAKVDQTLFAGDVASVTLPGSSGELTVLPHHAPLITALKAGDITVRLPAQAGSERGESQKFEIERGLLEVNSQGATVLL